MQRSRVTPIGWPVVMATLAIAVASPVAAQEATSDAFPAVTNTQEIGATPLLSPQEALASIRLPKGFQAHLFAAEPDIQQPIAITFDARGRLWAVENYTYAESARNFATELRDRIVILEDTDHDGRADKRIVFWDQGIKLTSIEVGLDGVWVLGAPNLLFIPDRDRDDKPDSQPIVVLDGWNGDAVRHNIVNGLRWGPDGWLYGRHGILATSQVGPPGTSPDQRRPINVGIWRYHPTRQTFEVVAHGTTNPWGTDWDEHGELFFSNTVIGHLWHVVPGAHFERMFGEDLTPNLYSLLPQTGDHVHWSSKEAWGDVRKAMSPETANAGGGHAHCGLMIYQGDNWPAEYRDQAFMINLHGRRLNRDRLAPSGSTHVATHEADMVFVGDPWFRGIDLMTGPDGSVWIADWSDIGECHENDGVHRTSGRIYKISFGTPEAPVPHALAAGDLRTLNAERLVALVTHKNEWIARQVRLEFQRRKGNGDSLAGVPESLGELFRAGPDTRTRLRALWSLHAIDADPDRWLAGLLGDEDHHVRRWAVRLLVDHGRLDEELSLAFIDRASREEEPSVLLALVCALPSVPERHYWPLATALSAHGELESDAYYSRVLWYHIAAPLAADAERAIALSRAAKLSFLRRAIARRLGQDYELFHETINGLSRQLAESDDAAWQGDILHGLRSGLAGRRKVAAPAAWANAVDQISRHKNLDLLGALREISVVFGDGRAVREVLELAGDDRGELSSRRQAIQVLVASRAAEVAPILLGLLAHRDLAPDAVRGLAALGGDETADLLLSRYASLSPPAKAEVVQALVARRPFARRLLDGIEKGTIDRGQLTAFQIRQLTTLGDEEIRSRVMRLWPELAEKDKLLEEKISHYAKLVRPEAVAGGDPSAGRVLFQRACSSCHKLFGEGGSVGPELTGAQRGNLRYLLENILEPSAQVGENYRLSTVVMTDGRVISGIIGQQTTAVITVQMPTEKLLLPRDEIEEMIPSQLSLMPESLLGPLAPGEIVNLFAYLMSSPPEPVASPTK